MANACAHPVLAGRAKELGAVQQMRNLLENSAQRSSFAHPSEEGRRQRAETVIARLTASGRGDIEEGGGGVEGGVGGGGKLQLYTFKWGVRPSVKVSFALSPKGKLACLVWLVMIYFILKPVVWSI